MVDTVRGAKAEVHLDYLAATVDRGSSPRCILCESEACRPLAGCSLSAIQALYRQQFGLRLEVPHDLDSVTLIECRRCRLKWFWPPVVGGAAFYDALQESPLYYSPEKYEYKIAKQHIAPGARLLEIGAGYGDFSEIANQSRYTGLEISPKAVERARQANRNVRGETLEQHLRTIAEPYDAVCAFQVLEHVPNPRELIHQSLFALRSRGLLIVGVPNDATFLSYWYNNTLNLPPHHQTRWRPETLAFLAQLFPVSLVAMEKEQLADYGIFLNSICDEFIRRLLRRNPSPADLFYDTPLMRKIRRAMRKVLRPRLLTRFLRSDGHTVVAIPQKW